MTTSANQANGAEQEFNAGEGSPPPSTILPRRSVQGWEDSDTAFPLPFSVPTFRPPSLPQPRVADIKPVLPSLAVPGASRVSSVRTANSGGAVITVPADFNRLVEKIAQETGLEKGEVLRRALGLMNVAVEARKQGNTVGILDQDGNIESEIVGLGI